MADRKWTKAQELAIKTHGGNILVSAAAGSGKTAVLVERVIRMISRKENPVDIDRLLVMTFTRAAAAQMKQRIHRELRSLIAEDPDNYFLRKQLMKVQNARISTIDSLSAEIVRDHIQDVNVDPGFRIADEGELKLLKKEVLSNLLEQQYQEGTEAFLELVDYYMDRDDRKLEDIILTLHAFSESHPEPIAWLRAAAYPYREARENYSGETELYYPEGFKSWLWVFGSIVNDKISAIREMALEGLAISQMNYGPYKYEECFQQIIDFIEDQDDKQFDYRAPALEEFLKSWKRSPTFGKNDEVDPYLKDCAKDLRTNIKKALEQLKTDYLRDDLDLIFAEMAGCASVAATLSELAVRFDKELAKAKTERGILDFSDIAHYALKVLMRYNLRGEIMRDKEGNPVYTEAANALASQIDEVIVDEYQDTNMLQEYLIRALSAERFGKPNVFMVGDVKQSIYGFRMACPELFREKMDTYRELDPDKEDVPEETYPGYLIRLDRNFRSRKEVLDFTNYIFDKSMLRSVGGIEYKEGHSLVYGGSYGEADMSEPKFVPEVYVIESKGDKSRYLEGYEVAKQVEELSKTYDLSDIVILARNTDNPYIEQVLSERGIPVLKSSNKGFFDSFEIRLLLDLLAVIDNPFQDIAFTALLYSPLCSASPQDLARIRMAGDEHDSIYTCLKKCTEYPELTAFLSKLQSFRECAAYMGIGDFITYVMDESGLNNIFLSMPLGQDRLANIAFLKEKAASYARGSYVGLDSFIRYLTELQKSKQDFGSINASADTTSAVRMMTIHKSKGLEFKAVILTGCGKGMNFSDLKNSIIPSRTLGLGMEYRDPELRIIQNTALLQTIREEQKKELIAENIRLLYVALTRAEEKLIITGIVSDLEKAQQSWDKDKQEQLKPNEILSAGSFIELLGRTLYPVSAKTDLFRMHFETNEDLEEVRAAEVMDAAVLKSKLQNLAKEAAGRELYLDKILEYAYPYEKSTQMQVKMTASQLEKRQNLQYSDESNIEYKVDDRYEAGDEALNARLLKGAQRGNAYHRFFELFDYKTYICSDVKETEVKRQLEDFALRGLIPLEYAQTIEVPAFNAFLESDIGLRMAQAAVTDSLYRERQFVMGYTVDVNKEETLTGKASSSDKPDEELLLVQGIIDAWFIEESDAGEKEIVLVDYKTDRVKNEQHYIETYRPQLNAYADALERSLKMHVKERLVYSVELGRAIVL